MENEFLYEQVQLLDDVHMTTLTVNEESRGKRPGVLSTVEGPFMEIEELNRNTRVYSLSLVENKIINLPYTKEMMTNKTLLGEGRHPKDRYEIWATEASHNITDLWISDDKKMLMGRADILDTPMGRIIQTLVDYGSSIGISARATGKVIKRNGKFYVDEDSYSFKTFDFVTNPGFGKARLEMVNESCEDYLGNIYTSMRDLIESDLTDFGTLNAVKAILESIDSEESKALMEDLNSRLENNGTQDREQELVETIDTLNEVNKSLKEENESLVARLKEANRLLEGYSVRESRLSREFTQKETSLNTLIGKKSEIISDLREESEYLSSQVKILSEQNASLSHDNEVLESLVVSLDTDNKSLNEDIESLREVNKSLEESLNSDSGVSEKQTVSEVKEEVRTERMKAPVLESVVDAPKSVSITDVPKVSNQRLERMFKNQNQSI